jgi:peroxiredoxin
MTEPVEQAKSSGSKYLLPGVAVIVAVAIGAWVFLGSGSASDEGVAGSDLVLGVTDDFRPEIGGPAPDFVLVDGRDASKVIRLSDFRGTPVVLNWYATWCAPCRAEIPDFRDASNTLDGQIVILGVNLQESAEQAIGLLDEFDATYPTVLDSDGSVFEFYRGIGMPTTLFIDADGIIVESGAGRVTEDALVTALGNLGIDYEPPADD